LNSILKRRRRGSQRFRGAGLAKGKSKVKGQKSKVASQRLSGRTQSGGCSVAAGDSAAGLWQRWAPADRHLFQIELFPPRLRLTFGFGRTTVRARRPWRRQFRLIAAFPWGVSGPVGGRC